MKTVKKQKSNSLSPFIEGFSSVFNISGPEPKEYLILFESNYKKALKSNWEKVGREIQSSINSIDIEIQK